MTHGPLKSDGTDLFQGFHHGKSRSLITRTPKFAIPDFLNWEISRHVASLNQTVQILSRGFHNGKSRSLITRTPEFLTPNFLKWEILRHMASFNQTTQIHFKAFALIHWGFNPQVSPDRSNCCRVFQPISDGSDNFLTCVLSNDSWDVERSTVRMLSWTLGIYGHDLFATHEDTESHRGKALNILLSPTKSNGHE
jgi:hypothetical protein